MPRDPEPLVWGRAARPPPWVQPRWAHPSLALRERAPGGPLQVTRQRRLLPLAQVLRLEPPQEVEVVAEQLLERGQARALQEQRRWRLDGPKSCPWCRRRGSRPGTACI